MLSVLKKSFGLCILICSVFSANIANAQRPRWEIGGLLGTTHYLGDINKEPDIRQTKLAVSIWGKYNMSRHFSYRFGLGYGRVQAFDSLYPAGKLRDLGFRSDIVEVSNIFEFNFHPFNLNHPKNKRVTFYVLSGLSIFYYNPQAKLNGQWVNLRPLATEGQDLTGGNGKYSAVSVAIPIGGGIKWRVGTDWVLGLEIGYRKTYTDYLDDISGRYPDLNELRNKHGENAAYLSDPSVTGSSSGEGRSAKNDMRGDPHLKDWYIMSGVTISYCFPNKRCFGQSKSKRFQLVD